MESMAIIILRETIRGSAWGKIISSASFRLRELEDWIHSSVPFYDWSSDYFLRRLCSLVEHEILKDELLQKRGSMRGWNGKHIEPEKHPKAKRKQQKKETPCGYKTDIFISPCSFLTYCTFLQKLEKRTWLYSSLFFSSLEIRMKLTLVWGQSRACRNERPVLFQEVGWGHHHQYRWNRNALHC